MSWSIGLKVKIIFLSEGPPITAIIYSTSLNVISLIMNTGLPNKHLVFKVEGCKLDCTTGGLSGVFFLCVSHSKGVQSVSGVLSNHAHGLFLPSFFLDISRTDLWSQSYDNSLLLSLENILQAGGRKWNFNHFFFISGHCKGHANTKHLGSSRT